MNWDPNFKIGHQHIDQHHEELFYLTHTLDLFIHSHQKEDLEDIITFLEHYVTDHFHEEETIMLHYKFDGFESHKHEHLLFRDDVNRIRLIFDEEDKLTHCVFLIRQLIDNIMVHVLNVDQKIASLVKDYQHEKPS